MRGRLFTPERDIAGKEPDGRTFIVAHGGVPILYDKAVALGIVPDAGDGASAPQNDQHAATVAKDAPSQPAAVTTPRRTRARQKAKPAQKQTTEQATEQAPTS